MKNNFELPDPGHGDPKKEHPAGEYSEYIKDSIEEADKPIRTILKRLNAFVTSQFPDIGIETVSSCSGHVQENGELMTNYCPHIIFAVSSDKISTRDKEKIQQNLKKFLNSVVQQADNTLGNNSISLEDKTKSEAETVYDENGKSSFYLFRYYFIVNTSEQGFSVLKNFWSEFEKTLNNKDGQQFDTDFALGDFLKNQ